MVGKWHLGLGKANEALDWNGDIKPGPRELGFDYSFHMAATGDRVPTVYIENGRIVNLDSTDPVQVSYSGRPLFRLTPAARRGMVGLSTGCHP